MPGLQLFISQRLASTTHFTDEETRFRKDDVPHPFRGKIMTRIQSPFCSRQRSWQRAAPLGPQMA